MSSATTLRLLGKSVVVSVSGGFKVYVAYLMLNVRPNVALCIASALIIYSVYTLDRALKSKEDEVNRKREESVGTSSALLVVNASLVIAVMILINEGISPVVAFWPFIIGFLYAKGLKLGKKIWKLKGSFGIKNFVVAFTWTSSLGMLIYPAAGSFSMLILISTFFFFKSFINTIIYDYRDAKGDYLAGLKTIPVYLGEARTRIILQLLNSLLHISIITLVLLGLAEIEMLILLYSWIVGLIYISFYTNFKRANTRDAIIDGEWIHMVIFRILVIRLY